MGLAAALIGWSGIAAVLTATAGKALGTTLSIQGGRRWGIAWSLFLMPMVVWCVITASYTLAVQMVGQAAFGIAAGIAFFGVSARPRLAWWLIGGLASLLLVASAGAYLSSRLLQPYDDATIQTRLTAHGVAQLITSSQQGPVAHRSWLHAGGAGYRLSGYVRAGRNAASAPDGITITLDWPGRGTAAQARLVPSSNWTVFEVQANQSEIDNPEFLIARLYSSSAGTFEIRSLRLDALSGPAARTPRPSRQELLSGHPVLLAHLAVTLGAAILAISGPSAVGLLGTLLALLVALAAGSRGALAVMAIWSLLVPLATTWSKPKKLSVVIAITAIALGAGLATQEVRSAALESAPPRTRIWKTAWTAFMDHPVLGLEGDGINTIDYFQAQTSTRVSHAHNLVLHFAASYGIFGALAAALLLIAILALAIRNRGTSGVVIILPIIVLNMIDATLFDARILVATVFAISALQRDQMSATLTSSHPEPS